jgi:hypothetical protein
MSGAISRFRRALDVLWIAEEDDERVSIEAGRVPQRLKAHCKQITYGAAEAAPLQNNDFSAASEGVRLGL